MSTRIVLKKFMSKREKDSKVDKLIKLPINVDKQKGTNGVLFYKINLFTT